MPRTRINRGHQSWRRGKLLPKAKASMLLGLLGEFGPVRGVP
jgi:hypothetical protein